MRSIIVEKFRSGDWAKKFLTLDCVSNVIDESCKIYGPSGNLLAVLLRNGVSEESIRKAWFHLKDYWPVSLNRRISSGSDGKPYIKKDGSVSNTILADPANSGIIGFMDRYPRTPYCRQCSWNQHNPEGFQNLLPAFQEVSEKFREVWPEKWSVNKSAADRTHKDFVIPGTVFTTVTVNKNYRTAAHMDPHNLENSISPMLVIHDGKIRGGELVLPELDLALRFRNGDLVWFENTATWHSNAPIYAMGSESQRCSLVFYFRSHMSDCGSFEEELERAKNRKPGDPMWDN